MKVKTIISWGSLLAVLFLAAGIASCSNADQRPLDTFYPAFPNPLPRSPVGLIVTDPVFRQVEPDPLIEESYKAADLTIMTSSDLWDFFKNASQRIDLVATRITNSNTVAMLVGIANKGVQINIVTERGYFDDSESAPLISQLVQAGNITIKIDDDDVARQVHSSYAIIDDHIVLSSSGDFLDDSFNTSINSTFVIETPRTYVDGVGPGGVNTVTDAFLFDFDQMFNQGRFGGDKEILGHNTFNIGVQVEVYFGPNDNLFDQILQELNNMQDSMLYAIHQLSDANMAGILRSLGGGGYGFGFYDWPSNPNYSDEDSPIYIPAAVPFYWPGFNAMGHKFMLIDLPANVTTTIDPVILDVIDPVVIAGSCNWTTNGLELNDEQMLVIHDLTLSFEMAVEASALLRECYGIGVVYGTVRTNKNVPIPEAEVFCDSEAIPGGFFNGDGGEPTEDETNAWGNYFLAVPTGAVRNIRVEDLGEASGLYLLPDPIWGEDQPNEHYNLMPGASYRLNFYCSPRPSATGTGGGGGGGGGFGH